MAKVKKPKSKAEKKSSKRAGDKPKKEAASRRPEGFEDDDLPPEDAEIEENDTLDTELLAAEVVRQESKGSEEDAESVVAPLPAVAADDDIDASDADLVLPSMEGMSILRETELNDVINDVKRRSEANGGYVTYEELNQILPSNIVDAIQSDKYLKILEALGVQVIREEDVKNYLEAKNVKQVDLKARAAEMIEDPIRYISDFAKAGADIITFHLESCDDPLAVIEEIRKKEARCGLSISPATPVEKILPYLDKVDMVLIMTVVPGFGGQALIPETLDKVRVVRRHALNRDLKLDIQVDGGIKADNIGLATEAGANIIVAGSAIFGSKKPRAVIAAMREEAAKHPYRE